MLLVITYTPLTLSMDTSQQFIFEPSYKAAVFGQLKLLIRQGKWKQASVFEPQIRKLTHQEWEKIICCCAQYKDALNKIVLMYKDPQVAYYFQEMKGELQEIAQTGLSFEADIHMFRQREFARWRKEYQGATLRARMRASALLQYWYYDQEQQLAAIQQNIAAYTAKTSPADILKYISKKEKRAILFWNMLQQIEEETWEKYLVGHDELTHAAEYEYKRKEMR